MPRPSKCTPERRDRAVEALRRGASHDEAARYATLSHTAYHKYRAEGDRLLEEYDHDLAAIPASERGFAEFAYAVTQARTEWELASVNEISSQGHGKPYERTKVTTTEVLKDGQIVTLTTTVVEKGVTSDWRALFELMRARNPREYGRLTRTEITGKDGEALDIRLPELIARGEAALDELAARRSRKTG